MTPQEADRIIHEARGKKWHVGMNPKLNPSYTEDGPFLEMLEWVMGDEIHKDSFLKYIGKQLLRPKGARDDWYARYVLFINLILDRPRMVALVAEWIEQREGGEG